MAYSERNVIEEVRTAANKAACLRSLIEQPDLCPLVEKALAQAGSLTALTQLMGSSSYSTFGSILRGAGITIPPRPNQATDGASEEDDEHNLAYYQARTKRLEREAKKHTELYANIRAIMRDVMREYPVEQAIPVSYQPVTPDLADEEIPFIFISDTHCGELVTKEHTSGLTSYSTELFVERCGVFQDALDRIVNGHLRKAYPLKKAVVALLGDNVAGEDIFPMQPHRIDRGLVFQMAEGAVHLARLLRWIAGMFDQVYVYAVPGNHGRTKTTTLNADFILYMLMRERLSNQYNLRFMLSESDLCGIYIDHSLGLLDWPEDILGRRWNYLFTHGHQTHGWMGIPYYGLDRFTQRIAPTTGILWDHTFCGHHHQNASTDDWTVIGSWVGGTDYSVGRMQKASQPKQLIRGFNPRYGLTWSYPIYLGEKPCLTTGSEETPGMYTPHNQLVDHLDEIYDAE